MKNNLKRAKLYLTNILQILRDKRHEQKSKALAFALTYSILPILLLINLTIAYLPPKFLEMIEDSISFLPDQYSQPVIDIIQSHNYQDYNLLIYIFLILFVLYTVSSNVRLVIEISNDCYEYSQERSKIKELLISAILFIFIGFGVLSLFAIILAGQALRAFLEINNANNIASIINQILQMKMVVTFLILFMVFYIIYYFAPNIKSTFKSTIIGTLMSTIGLFFASYGFEIYLAKSSTYETLYGAVYSQYLLFLFGMYITCQIIVGSMIVNSLIFEKINIKNYHLDHKKSIIDIDFDTVHMSLDELKEEIKQELLAKNNIAEDGDAVKLSIKSGTEEN